METSQAPMPFAVPTLTEFNPSSMEPGGTYIVSTKISISRNIEFEENVTLIFLGGRLILSGSQTYTLTAKNTRIIAGISHIFDVRLNFLGSWIMDRAYPQWFGADNQEKEDASDAINKAIKLKRVGEVFIPRGVYKIQKTIEVSTGIILKGEKALTYFTSTMNPTPSQENYIYQGTVLRTYSAGNFLGGYAVLINIDTSGTVSADAGTWVAPFPEFHTGLSDIYFYNEKVNNLKGVLAAGGFDIQYCRWDNFSQAVGTTNNYSDLKSITHCVFFNENTHTIKLYAFDLRGGDAATFKNITFYQNNKNLLGGLRLVNCFGAEIANNIFNDGVFMRQCKAINFSSNHMEQKTTQVVIENSSVDISNNYFEKGEKPSLVLTGTVSNDFERTVVTLNNNCFAYYENETGIPSANAYDIMINGALSLSINKSFRYWVTRNATLRQSPYGLMICDTSSNPVAAFNEHSYFLSNSGQILPGPSVPANNSAILTQTVSSAYHAVNGVVKWKGNTGSYTYRLQVLWDKTRKLVGTNILSLGTYTLTNGGSGFLVTLSGLNAGGVNCFIRVERTSGSTKQICDVPLCGGVHLYDNGLDICGYRWESGELLSGLAILNTIQFSGRNVICRAASVPQVGTWTDGDIVYNTGSGTNTLWIRVNGAFTAK